MITKEEALECFSKGIDCSQIVFGEFSEQLGLGRKTALKISSAFGGGMWSGNTCGCVTGALMVLGLKYGQSENVDVDKKQKLLGLKTEFEKKFSQRYGSCICKKMLGYDVSNSDEMKKIMEENLFEKICSKAVVSACEIIRDILDEENN